MMIREFTRSRCNGGALLLLSTVLGGCASRRSMLSPAGPGARSLAELGTISMIAFTVVTVIVWAMLILAVTRRRGSLAEHAPVDIGGGQLWIWIGGIGIPVVVFAALFVMTLRKMDEFPLHREGTHSPEIRLIGRQWWWEVQYLGERPSEQVVTANEIHIPVGQPIEIELQSRDVIHSFWIPELHGKVDLVPGWSNHITIQADRSGTFDGQCAEYCGAEHTMMRLLVIAEPKESYARWIARQAEPAETPSEPLARAGQSLFEDRACGLCHTVRGTRALGSVGPDLTHVGSRHLIAANSLPNEHAYLMAWATRAQSLKPEVRMPNLTEFDGSELNHLAHYLEALR